MNHKVRRSLLALAACLPVAGVVARAATFAPLTRHVRDVVTSGQAPLVGQLPANQSLRLVFVLPHTNEDALQHFLQDLYNPASASYRQFLTVEEFTARYGPTQADYDTVIQFVQSHGLTVVGTSPNRMNLDVTGTVANIQSALHVNLGVYQDPAANRTFYAIDREPTPDLPFSLWRIAGLDDYSVPQPALARRAAGAQPEATTGSCPQASFCGSDMRAAYYGGTFTGTGQSLGLLEYVGTDLADLATYYQNAGQTNNVPVTLVSVDGTSTSCLAANNCDDTEQTIDMTQALGMAPGLSSLVMYIGSSDAAIFNAMATAKPLNAQLSSSWTWYPADPGTDNPYFEEFAAQGQNLFQAAGDSGAWHPSSTIFPADDVYLTTVGGTDLNTASAGGPWASETVWANGGGGISPNKFAIPSWQTAAAAGCTACSQTLRNAPDVAANSNYTFYVCANQTTCSANAYGGTSFAAPMWAGYLAIVNQHAVNKTGKPVGFINPTIYSIGANVDYDANFHDIVSGSNGFSATVGYDLATGWGSPNGTSLLSTLIGGPSGPGFAISASPSPVTIQQGNSGTATITSTAVGSFSGTIALTASGQPKGVTVAFNPASITGSGTSTMTITVPGNTNPGTYDITVTGTSGSSLGYAAVTLIVTGNPVTFTLSANPTTVTLKPGQTGTSTITSTVQGGFDAAVTLSESGGGNSQTVTLSPTKLPAPGAGTSTLTIKVGAGAAAGKHNITVTGKGGGLTKTVTVVLDITK